MARFLIQIGILLIVLGIIWPFAEKLGIGRLPGDLLIKKGNFTFYFPLVTCIVFSVAITLLINLFRKF